MRPLANATQVWGMRVKDFEIRIRETDNGITVDVLNAFDITGEPLASTFAYDNECKIEGV
jgi:hypothetical protein